MNDIDQEKEGREPVSPRRQDEKPSLVPFSMNVAMKLLGLGVLGLLIYYATSGITVVKSDEVAMILRFGHLVGDTPAQSIHQPGLLFALPKPFDEVVRVKVKKIYEIEIHDLRHSMQPTGGSPGMNFATFTTDSIDPEYEGYCLTGDNNIVQPFITAKYQINDPVAYSFGNRTPASMLRSAVMAAMTRSVGEVSVDSVLSEGKKQLSTTVFHRVQRRLDAAGSGMVLISLEFNEIVPPRHVMQDFKAVQNAFIDKETKVKEAMSYKEQEIPRAEADREAMLREADAYAAELLSSARGDADSFRNLVGEYKKNPDVVRERLYREHIEGTLGWSGGAVLIPAPEGRRYEDLRLMIPGE